MRIKTLASLKSEYNALIKADNYESDIANSFPRGVGLVAPQNRKSRSRAIERGIDRAKRIVDLASRIESAERAIAALPMQKARVEIINFALEKGTLAGNPLTREDKKSLISMRSDLSRAIKRSEKSAGDPA